MKKVVYLVAILGIATVAACSKDNPMEDECVLTRSTNVNDSTDNTKGGIQVDTV